MASVKEIWSWDFQCYKKEKTFIALSQFFSLNNYYIIWYLQYFQRNTFSVFVFSSNISMILDFPNEYYNHLNEQPKSMSLSLLLNPTQFQQRIMELFPRLHNNF